MPCSLLLVNFAKKLLPLGITLSILLLSSRQEWDVYLSASGSSLPQGWVTPQKPSDDSWATALQAKQKRWRFEFIVRIETLFTKYHSDFLEVERQKLDSSNHLHLTRFMCEGFIFMHAASRLERWFNMCWHSFW